MHKEIQGVGFSNNLLKNKKLNKEKKCGATISPSASNSVARAQFVDRAVSKSKNNKNVMEFDSTSNKKNKNYFVKSKKKSASNILKIFGATGLAVFMGVGTLLGVLIVPMNSANAGALNGAANTQSGLGSEGLNGGAGLSSGGAGGCGYGDNGACGGEYGGARSENGISGGEAVVLDPESDKTIFTTESGFEIKSHNVAGQTLANSKVQYFTLGSYNGTPLNWIILATSPTLAENTTDAGVAINAANANGLVSMMADSKLSANQALVISEKALNESYKFSVSASGTRTQTLPASSNDGSGWNQGSSAIANAEYYAKLLIDAASDYYSTAPSLNFGSTLNSLLSSSLGLSSYLGNQIVKNSNFNSTYYGFAMTSSQITTYLPTSLRTAYNFSGTAVPYWLGAASLNYSITQSTEEVGYDRVYSGISGGTMVKKGKYYYYLSGYGNCTITSANCYITSSGALSSTTLATIKGTLGHNTDQTAAKYCKVSGLSYTDYVYLPTCSYATTYSFQTAYYRPAMVVDLSKF